MNQYYAKRFAQAAVTLYAAVTLTFVLIRLLPGGPVAYLKAKMLRNQENSGLTRQQINERVAAYANVHPNDPIPQAYVDYTTSVVTGDLGQSIIHQRPVFDILVEALPWTLFVSSVTMTATFTIGIALGAVMAYAEGSRFDLSTSSLSVLLTSIPFYVFAIVVLYLLAYQAGLFPTSGAYANDVTVGLNVEFVASALHHAALPLITLVVTGFGGTALSMRGNSIHVIGEDYMRVAELRGLSDRVIALRYVGRNAVLPMYTGLMISIGGLVGGSVIFEEIFRYPGVGFYLFNAVSSRDYPLMMGGFLFITTLTIVGILVADLTYGLIDPRAGSGGGDSESY